MPPDEPSIPDWPARCPSERCVQSCGTAEQYEHRDLVWLGRSGQVLGLAKSPVANLSAERLRRYAMSLRLLHVASARDGASEPTDPCVGPRKGF